MSIEALVMNYRDGDPRPLSFQAICKIFDTPGTTWNPDHNCLNVQFHDPPDYVDIYCGCDAMTTGEVAGLTIARPILHRDYLGRLYRLLQLDNVMLFYTDETTPVFHPSGDPSHYPSDLLAELGTPRYADGPDKLSYLT